MSDHASPSLSLLALALGQPVAAGGVRVPGGIMLPFLASSCCREALQALKASFMERALNLFHDKVVADVKKLVIEEIQQLR